MKAERASQIAVRTFLLLTVLRASSSSLRADSVLALPRALAASTATPQKVFGDLSTSPSASTALWLPLLPSALAARTLQYVCTSSLRILIQTSSPSLRSMTAKASNLGSTQTHLGLSSTGRTKTSSLDLSSTLNSLLPEGRLTSIASGTQYSGSESSPCVCLNLSLRVLEASSYSSSTDITGWPAL